MEKSKANKKGLQLITTFFKQQKNQELNQSTQIAEEIKQKETQSKDKNAQSQELSEVTVHDYGKHKTQVKRKSQPFQPKGIIFPIRIKFPIVAKFLCHAGQADKWINFHQAHHIFIEREPKNKYDQKAIKVGVKQHESFLLADGQSFSHNLIQDKEEVEKQQNNEDYEKYLQTFYLGYAPKDIAYNLSVILDNPKIFNTENVIYSTQGKQSFIEVDIHLQQKVLRDQRIPKGQNYQLKRLPGMPAYMRQAVYATAKNNLNKNVQGSIDIEELEEQIQQEEEEVKNQEEQELLNQERIKNEQNKYNRNFILVIETVKNYPNLFDESEKEMLDIYVKKISSNAQTILARLMLRKRKWFNSAVHLAKYFSDQNTINEALTELETFDFIQADMKVIENLLRQLQNQDEQPQLEELVEFLEDITSQKLQDINKFINKTIKGVRIENYVNVLEVGLNPFYGFQNHLEGMSFGNDIDSLDKKIRQLYDLNKKLTKRFSGMISEYMLDNQKKFKQAINKRNVIHKILRKIQALLMIENGSKDMTLNQSVNLSMLSSNDNQHNLLRFFTFQQQSLLDVNFTQVGENKSQSEKKKVQNLPQFDKIRQKLEDIMKGIRIIINGNNEQILFKIAGNIDGLLS
ncbi:UNKNOWN [Stylonychia lemnae]|uniref:Fanconi-associated nuclease n=1 Tax=Stylonychia lemnae TaxID=5949 RepID=A0A078ASZ9_STYLE|nr:UNKNOWN [Stylonychia lemnae]|eukprot:CDW85590.1 UNKNOWN [Stylonychia lemnae]